MLALGKSSSGRSLGFILLCPCQPGFKNTLAHNIKDWKNLSLVAFPFLSWLFSPMVGAQHRATLHASPLDLPGAGFALSPVYVPGIPQAEETLLTSCPISKEAEVTS